MSRRRRGDPAAVVPDVEPRSYYDQPVIKPPVWTVEIPWYFFAGGLAGASSILAFAARRADLPAVAAAAERAAAAGALVSPVLLISDLGRPSRFYNMLRVLKPTSPMSVGSWVLAGYIPAAVATAVLGERDQLPGLQALAGAVAAALGPALVTYTAVLFADTAVPVWHEARRELPFAFAGGAVQSAGAAATVLVAPDDAGAARRTLVAGSVLREAANVAMHRRLGDLAAPLDEGTAGRHATASRALSAAGTALVITAGRRRRSAAVAGGLLALAGAAHERFAVFRAGFGSALDPVATVGPQRARRTPAGAVHRS